MAGIRTVPTAEVSATAAPVIPAKNIATTMVMWERAPRMCPTIALATLIRRSKSVVMDIRSPARTKKGMQRRM